MSGLREVLAPAVGAWTSPDDYAWAQKMTADLETAVLDWLRARLASDEVREAVAAEWQRPEHAPMSDHDPRTGECVSCPWPAYMVLGPSELADAALTAVLAALEGTQDAQNRDLTASEDESDLVRHRSGDDGLEVLVAYRRRWVDGREVEPTDITLLIGGWGYDVTARDHRDDEGRSGAQEEGK